MAIAEQFQISAGTAATVVVTTVGVYLAFIVLTRITGPRALATTSTFDFACVVAFGAILGRTVLLTDPTLAIAVVALTTFLGMQAMLGAFRHRPTLYRLLNRSPVLLASDGRVLTENMRKAHVVEDELRQAVRRAGGRSLHDIACVVLERNGVISVVRSQEPVDGWLLADVDGGSAARVG